MNQKLIHQYKKKFILSKPLSAASEIDLKTRKNCMYPSNICRQLQTCRLISRPDT